MARLAIFAGLELEMITVCVMAGVVRKAGIWSRGVSSSLLLCLLMAALAFASESSSPPIPVNQTPCKSILFAVRQPGRGGHWYENFGYSAFDPEYKLYGRQGRLCRLDLESGDLQVLIDDVEGTVRDPQVHYGGNKAVLSYRPSGVEHFHLFEINLESGDLHQLTDGPWDDIEPTYLPDGDILFCSSRCNRWVPCWYSPVAVMHRCRADGSDVHPVSANIEHDNTPWPMPDGRVIYQRWEYVDRSRVSFHHLWTANPDGTGQMVYFGNQNPGTLMIDAKPIPTSDEVVAVFSPKHGRREHEGAIAIVSPKQGPDVPAAARTITTEVNFRDPYPVDRDTFLVARGPELLWMNRRGETGLLYRLPEAWVAAGAECHEPRPLSSRPVEPIIPPRVSAKSPTGRFVLMNAKSGRNMDGVDTGEIRRLLVLETLPKPVNDSGKMPPITFGGSYMLERILGTVDVQPDGSAYFEAPALRPLFFVALDEQNDSVQRMHSFTMVMPGEINGCIGCHEPRTQAGVAVSASGSMATNRPPQQIRPLEGIPEVFDFPRDIQPLLDRHCVTCHGNKRREGGVVLTGDRGPVYSQSYFALTAFGYVADGRDRIRTNLPPRTVGTSASPLMRMLDGTHYETRLSDHERDMIRYWIESAAVYPGTYAALGTGMIGGYPKSKLDTSDSHWPASLQAAAAIDRRCAQCHDRSRPLPRFLSDDMGFVLSNPDYDDPRVLYSRHRLFNLTIPQASLILLAPLDRKSGGLGACGTPVFKDASDPDYQAILAMCREGREHLEQIKRFDMPGFRPSDMYLREMQRCGILSKEVAEKDDIDPYQLDADYWESQWWQGERGDSDAATTGSTRGLRR